MIEKEQRRFDTMKIDYEHTLQVEIVTEFVANVINRLTNYLLRRNICLSEKGNPLVVLLDQLEDISSENLFEKTAKELEELTFFFQQMDKFIMRIGEY